MRRDRVGAVEEDARRRPTVPGPSTGARAGLDDGGLVGGDLLERSSPRRSVWSSPTPVMTATLGRRHARGVPAAAEADLEHGDLDAALAKEPQRRRREQLELGEASAAVPRRPQRARRGPQRADRAREVVARRPARRRPRCARCSARGAGSCRAPAAHALARARSAAVSRVTDVLPFVPVTWTDAKRVLRPAERVGERADAVERRVDAERQRPLERRDARRA